MSLDSSLSDYFLVVLQDGTEVAICNQEDCKFKARKVPNITGKPYFHTGNLGAHLKRKHPEQYVLLQAKRTLQGASTTGIQTAMDSFVSVSTEIPKKKLYQFELSRDEIESAAIEAVTVNGLPIGVVNLVDGPLGRPVTMT